MGNKRRWAEVPQYYGFGAVDANAAVTAAGNYTAGSLGSQSTSSWITQSVDANLGEKRQLIGLLITPLQGPLSTFG